MANLQGSGAGASLRIPWYDKPLFPNLKAIGPKNPSPTLKVANTAFGAPGMGTGAYPGTGMAPGQRIQSLFPFQPPVLTKPVVQVSPAPKALNTPFMGSPQTIAQRSAPNQRVAAPKAVAPTAPPVTAPPVVPPLPVSRNFMDDPAMQALLAMFAGMPEYGKYDADAFRANAESQARLQVDPMKLALQQALAGLDTWQAQQQNSIGAAYGGAAESIGRQTTSNKEADLADAARRGVALSTSPDTAYARRNEEAAAQLGQMEREKAAQLSNIALQYGQQQQDYTGQLAGLEGMIGQLINQYLQSQISDYNTSATNILGQKSTLLSQGADRFQNQGQFDTMLPIQQQGADASTMSAKASMLNAQKSGSGSGGGGGDDFYQFMKLWEATGKAPYSAFGVTAGAPMSGSATSQWDNIQAQHNIDQYGKQSKIEGLAPTFANKYGASPAAASVMAEYSPEAGMYTSKAAAKADYDAFMATPAGRALKGTDKAAITKFFKETKWPTPDPVTKKSTFKAESSFAMTPFGPVMMPK